MSACSCINKDYDAHVDSTDCKTLIYEDQSRWMSEDDGYTVPETYDLTIKTPSGKEVTIEANVQRGNYFTSVDLFGDESPRCLSDGLYCFSVISCKFPYSVVKPYLCNAQCKIDIIYARANSDRDRKYADNLQRLIDGIVSACNTQEIQLAEELLEILNDRLNNEECNHC